MRLIRKVSKTPAAKFLQIISFIQHISDEI